MNVDYRSPRGQLQLGYALVTMAVGLDKFTRLLVDWDRYLSPALRRKLPMRRRTFVGLVGLAQLGIGALLLGRPKVGAYAAAGWLAASTANLLSAGEHLDIAAADALLSLGALSLARMSSEATVTLPVHAREEPEPGLPEYYAPVRTAPVEEQQRK